MTYFLKQAYQSLSTRESASIERSYLSDLGRVEQNTDSGRRVLLSLAQMISGLERARSLVTAVGAFSESRTGRRPPRYRQRSSALSAVCLLPAENRRHALTCVSVTKSKFVCTPRRFENCKYERTSPFRFFISVAKTSSTLWLTFNISRTPCCTITCLRCPWKQFDLTCCVMTCLVQLVTTQRASKDTDDFNQTRDNTAARARLQVIGVTCSRSCRRRPCLTEAVPSVL